MPHLSPEDREKLREAVRAAERRTRAEFVLVIARRADPYLFLTLAIAAVAALLVPGILWAAAITTSFPILYVLQLGVFAVLAGLLRLPSLWRLAVPAALAEARGRFLAHNLFHRLGLHRTRERTGILVFVALAEHYVEIIADEGADKAVPPATWQEIIQVATDRVRRDGPVSGFSLALDMLGNVLAEALPRRADDMNEIPDRLIEL